LENLAKELKRIQNLAPVMKQIGISMVSSTKLRFNQGVDPDRDQWKPRSEAYKKQLARERRLTNKVLVVTGTLQKSIGYRLEGDRDVNIGTDVEYSTAMNRGDPSQNIPARRFLGVSENDRNQIQRIIDKFLRAES